VPDTQSSEKNPHTYLYMMYEMNACITVYGFIIVITDLFSLSVEMQTRHTARLLQNILLQFPQHTSLKATNPPANHTVLDKLTSYILCTFLFQDTSRNILMPLLQHDALQINSNTNDHIGKLNHSDS